MFITQNQHLPQRIYMVKHCRFDIRMALILTNANHMWSWTLFFICSIKMNSHLTSHRDISFESISEAKQKSHPKMCRIFHEIELHRYRLLKIVNYLLEASALRATFSPSDKVVPLNENLARFIQWLQKKSHQKLHKCRLEFSDSRTFKARYCRIVTFCSDIRNENKMLGQNIRNVGQTIERCYGHLIIFSSW